ncbi:hypothetical protein NDF60_32710 [Streptomyces sp. STCH 565 A]|nr:MULTISPECIES: hypothetical protein [Streptomyces]MCM8555069.1 hypothetical protein [Streptomyces sp. STCH 565 A]
MAQLVAHHPHVSDHRGWGEDVITDRHGLSPQGRGSSLSNGIVVDLSGGEVPISEERFRRRSQRLGQRAARRGHRLIEKSLLNGWRVVLMRVSRLTMVALALRGTLYMSTFREMPAGRAMPMVPLSPRVLSLTEHLYDRSVSCAGLQTPELHGQGGGEGDAALFRLAPALRPFVPVPVSGHVFSYSSERQAAIAPKGPGEIC